MGEYDDRTIHIVIDDYVGLGKSSLCKYLYVEHEAVIVPPFQDSKRLMQYCMLFEPAKLYVIEIPRAMKKKNISSMYTGIETLKKGMMYDTRGNGKFRYIDEPNIVVFANTTPKKRHLSVDRWKMWKIQEKSLCPFKFGSV